MADKRCCINCRYFQDSMDREVTPMYYCNHFDTEIYTRAVTHRDRSNDGQLCWASNDVPHIHRDFKYGGYFVNVNDARLFKLKSFDTMTIYFEFEGADNTDATADP